MIYDHSKAGKGISQALPAIVALHRKWGEGEVGGIQSLTVSI